MDVGIDIVEISRIRKIVHRNKFFLETVFSEKELEQLRLKRDIYSSISSRFSAKESFFKCIGGIKYLDSLRLIEIINDESGKPTIVLNGYLASKFKNYEFSVSASHCKNYACSVVIKKKLLDQNQKINNGDNKW